MQFVKQKSLKSIKKINETNRNLRQNRHFFISRACKKSPETGDFCDMYYIKLELDV